MHDVVVGIDRSETASRALARAAEIAAALDMNLHVVTCADRTKSVDFTVGSDHFQADWREDATQFMESAIIRAGVHGPHTTRVGAGDPAEFLCAEARRLDARVIVVGNRRVQSMSRVLGAVASDVIKKAPCDVLVAHTAIRDE